MARERPINRHVNTRLTQSPSHQCASISRRVWEVWAESQILRHLASITEAHIHIWCRRYHKADETSQPSNSRSNSASNSSPLQVSTFTACWTSKPHNYCSQQSFPVALIVKCWVSISHDWFHVLYYVLLFCFLLQFLPPNSVHKFHPWLQHIPEKSVTWELKAFRTPFSSGNAL